MSFGHERLDVYQAAIEYVGWAYRLCERLKGHRSAKEQLLRASQAIALNIAEGNGKATDGDRRRYFEIARGSALECGAVQDVLEVCGALPAAENAEGQGSARPDPERDRTSASSGRLESGAAHARRSA
jgi:four helix bundle protein